MKHWSWKNKHRTSGLSQNCISVLQDIILPKFNTIQCKHLQITTVLSLYFAKATKKNWNGNAARDLIWSLRCVLWLLRKLKTCSLLYNDYDYYHNSDDVKEKLSTQRGLWGKKVLCPSQDRLKEQWQKETTTTNKKKTTKYRHQSGTKPKAKKKEQRGSGSARRGDDCRGALSRLLPCSFFVALITQTVLSDSGRVPRNDDSLRPLCGRGLSTFTSPMSLTKSVLYLSQSGWKIKKNSPPPPNPPGKKIQYINFSFFSLKKKIGPLKKNHIYRETKVTFRSMEKR